MSTKKYKVTVELTEKQLLILLKVVYLGNWMATSHHATIPKHLKKFDDIETALLKQAEKQGFKKYVDRLEDDSDSIVASYLIEQDDEVQQIVEEYDANTMWEDLADKLAWRDAIKKYGAEKLEAMTGLERMIAIGEISDTYQEVFQEKGLDAIEVKMKEANT